MLYKEKDKIENYLSSKTANIYQITSKYILYDLTNTHFEGKVKTYNKAKYTSKYILNHKQKRNDCLQVTLGLQTDENGFCKQSRYYAGNVSEPETFTDVVANAKKGKEQGMFEQKRQRFEKGLEDIKSSLTKARGNKNLKKIHHRIG